MKKIIPNLCMIPLMIVALIVCVITYQDKRDTFRYDDDITYTMVSTKKVAVDDKYIENLPDSLSYYKAKDIYAYEVELEITNHEKKALSYQTDANSLRFVVNDGYCNAELLGHSYCPAADVIYGRSIDMIRPFETQHVTYTVIISNQYKPSKLTIYESYSKDSVLFTVDLPN